MSHYAKPVLKVGARIIASYFSWMRKFAKHPEKYPFEYRYKKVRNLLIKLNDSFNVEFHVEGLENLPKGKYCLVSNHLSAYDPLSLICVLEEPCTFVTLPSVAERTSDSSLMRSVVVHPPALFL